jgi:hypothetical protein
VDWRDAWDARPGYRNPGDVQRQPALATNWQSWDHQITPTPEPATYGLMMTGALAGLLGWRRWKRKTAQ